MSSKFCRKIADEFEEFPAVNGSEDQNYLEDFLPWLDTWEDDDELDNPWDEIVKKAKINKPEVDWQLQVSNFKRKLAISNNEVRAGSMR